MSVVAGSGTFFSRSSNRLKSITELRSLFLIEQNTLYLLLPQHWMLEFPQATEQSNMQYSPTHNRPSQVGCQS